MCLFSTQWRSGTERVALRAHLLGICGKKPLDLRYIYVILPIPQPLERGSTLELFSLDGSPKAGGCQTKGALEAVLWRPGRLIAIVCGNLPVGENSSANEALGQRSRSESPKCRKGSTENGRPGEVERQSACWVGPCLSRRSKVWTSRRGEGDTLAYPLSPSQRAGRGCFRGMH